MKIEKLIIILTVLLFLASCSIFRKTGGKMPEEGGLIITDFTEKSNLEQAGAKRKDILWKYNGEIVYNIQQLGELKEQITSGSVEVEVLHNGKNLSLMIPAGQLGVYLLPIPREHTFDNDVKMIKGVGKLQWGNDMDITFLGALSRLDEAKGQGLSYDDLLVLSGYGFRNNFYDGW